MRSRMIKPEFWMDEKLATSCSRDARFLYIGLWNASDDYGVVRGNPRWLIGQLWPYDEISVPEFERILDELEASGRIVRFEEGGDRYYWIPKFLEHQSISHPSKARNPEPPETLQRAPETRRRHSGDSPEDSGDSPVEIEVEREREIKPVFNKPTKSNSRGGSTTTVNGGVARRGKKACLRPGCSGQLEPHWDECPVCGKSQRMIAQQSAGGMGRQVQGFIERVAAKVGGG